ncbi:MAG: SOS response-associated peptidase [Xanthobacteraceae bacterium]|uniref:SOS response-associated peptidase n=1 Tax=Pseudolabrys sp. TaxID=1960880 RepID=UPI003D0ECC49
MCGRYSMTKAPEAIRQLFRYPEQPNFPSRYNIAPSQPIAVVRLAEGGRHFALMRWGLLPSWVKDPANFALLFNARGETAAEKPAFRAAMKRRRCLIPADGFYEWHREGSRNRPFFIRQRSQEPFAFAGLWETWAGPNGEELDTAAIVTTDANATLRPIHHRMPVIVPASAFDLWLDPNADAKLVQSLIAPAPDDLLEAYAISTAVNRAANDGPALIVPAPDTPAEEEAPKPKRAPRRKAGAGNGGQGSLF